MEVEEAVVGDSLLSVAEYRKAGVDGACPSEEDEEVQHRQEEVDAVSLRLPLVPCFVFTCPKKCICVSHRLLAVSSASLHDWASPGLAFFAGGRGGRYGEKEKPKTAAELDKEMDDYFYQADPKLAQKVPDHWL